MRLKAISSMIPLSMVLSPGGGGGLQGGARFLGRASRLLELDSPRLHASPHKLVY